MTVMQIRHLAPLSGGFHQTWNQCQWVLSVRQLSIPELLHSKQDVYLEAVARACAYIWNSNIPYFLDYKSQVLKINLKINLKTSEKD